MKRLAATALASMFVLFPGGVAGLGLGNIEVESYLNEPLRAKIALRSVEEGDTDVLRVALGTPEQFKRAGITRPFLLAKLKFEVIEDGPGRAHIRVTTREPVAEPILNFLLELNWARGRVVREYAVFLDPKVYGAAISSSIQQSLPTVEQASPGSDGSAAGQSVARREKSAPVSQAPAGEPVEQSEPVVAITSPSEAPQTVVMPPPASPGARRDGADSRPVTRSSQTVTAPAPEAARVPAREPTPLDTPAPAVGAPAPAAHDDSVAMAADEPTPRSAGARAPTRNDASAPATARDPSAFDASELNTVISQDLTAEPVAPFPPRPVSKPRTLTTLSGTITGDIYGPTSDADTLWSIAIRARPDESISVNRMMLAILEANPEAFALDNVNTLQVGHVLRIPSPEQVGVDDQRAALAEVTRHHAAWEEYRYTMAATAGLAPQGTMATMGEVSPDDGFDAASGGSSSTLDGIGGTGSMDPGASESTSTAAATPDGESQATLRLLAAGTSTDQVGAVPGEQSDVQALRNDLNLALEEADSQRREREELASKLSEAEQLIADLQRLIELKDDDIAALQNQLTAPPQVEAASEPAPGADIVAPPITAPTSEPAVTGPTATGEPPESMADIGPSPDPVETVNEVAVDAESAPVEAGQMAPPTPPAGTTEQPSAGQPAVAEKPVKPPKPRPAPRLPPPAEPSWMDRLRDLLPIDPIVAAAGLGGVLLALIGGVALWKRRRRPDDADSLADFPAVAITADEALPDELEFDAAPDSIIIEELEEAVSAPPTDDARDEPVGTGTLDDDLGETAKLASGEEEDPLAEVNVYLAYERYDQAEALVRSAIAQYPSRHEYRLRLLEVFYAAKSVAAFEAAAQELQDVAGEDSPLMEKARTWWADLSPERALFTEAPANASVAALEESVFDADTGGGGAVDTVDIGEGVETESTGVDFDLSFDTDTSDQSVSDQSASVDFDLGLESVEEAVGESTSDGRLDFDLGNMDELADETRGEHSQGTEPDLDFSGLAGVDAPPGEALEADTEGSSIDFDLGSLDAGVAQSTDEEPVSLIEQVADATGTGIDFDLDNLEETRSPVTAASAMDVSTDTSPSLDIADGLEMDGIGEVGDTELGIDAGSPTPSVGELESFDLNLEVSAPEAAASTRDDGLTEVGSMTGGSFDFDIGPEAPDAIEVESLAGASASGEAADLDFSLDLATSVSLEDGPSGFEETAKSVDLELSMDLGESIDLAAATAPDSDDSESMFELSFPSQDGDDPSSDSGFDLGVPSEEADDSVGIDTEFRGVFPDQSDASGSSADGSIALDLELDSNADAAMGASGDSGLDLELESTLVHRDNHPSDEAKVLDLALDDGNTSMSADGDATEVMPDTEFESTQYMLREVPAENAPAGDGVTDLGRTLLSGPGLAGDVDEIQTKLDLAQAYIDMEDFEGARGILGEVLAEGSPAQQEQAKGLLSKLA